MRESRCLVADVVDDLDDAHVHQRVCARQSAASRPVVAHQVPWPTLERIGCDDGVTDGRLVVVDRLDNHQAHPFERRHFT